jgi:ribosome biogenesis GTP-binding protein YsxC/EngB
MPEYCFIGRSNVGKSSIINLITGQREIARTSKKPGKTQSINLFKVTGNPDWIIADLPGYGFAQVSKSTRGQWSLLIDKYVLARENLMCAFLLLDIRLPGMRGCDGIGVLKEKFQSVQILMLTINADEDSVFESICKGACGYLLKNTPPARLLEAIRETHNGGAPMSPEIARKVVTLFQRTGPPEKIDERLTPQETRMLKLLVEGYTYQGAADLLKISVHTARNHIRSIYDKLHVHSKSEAVCKALRGRIIY